MKKGSNPYPPAGSKPPPPPNPPKSPALDKAVRIEMSGHGIGKVFIDGQEVPHVKATKFEAEAGCANKLTIELVPHYPVEVSGPAEVVDVTSLADSERVWTKAEKLPDGMRYEAMSPTFTIAISGDVVFVEYPHAMSMEAMENVRAHFAGITADTGVKVVVLTDGMKVARVEPKVPRPEPPPNELVCECGRVRPAKCLLCRLMKLK